VDHEDALRTATMRRWGESYVDMMSEDTEAIVRAYLTARADGSRGDDVDTQPLGRAWDAAVAADCSARLLADFGEDGDMPRWKLVLD